MFRTARRTTATACAVVVAFLLAASPAAAQTAPVAQATVVVAPPGEPSALKVHFTDLLVSSVTAGSSREPARLDVAVGADEPVALLLPAVQKAREFVR
ncbi:MAG: hypothetical protein M3131_00400 [Actinomycetota bacterium]|nr:hypothetical protein [Actinomycetota bacterium]